jgi:hypothetical protein
MKDTAIEIDEQHGQIKRIKHTIGELHALYVSVKRRRSHPWYTVGYPFSVVITPSDSRGYHISQLPYKHMKKLG